MRRFRVTCLSRTGGVVELQDVQTRLTYWIHVPRERRIRELRLGQIIEIQK